MDESEKSAFAACELILDVRACMMFDSIHADWAVKEVLDKHAVSGIGELALKAEQMASKALGREVMP